MGKKNTTLPKGSGKITVIPKEKRGVSNDNIPNATMIKGVLVTEAKETGCGIEYIATGKEAIICFNFYETCDYPQTKVEEQAK